MSDIKIPIVPTLITNLTTEVETVNGGAQDDLINAQLSGDESGGSNTLQSADIINGGDGEDMLRLIVDGAGTATVSGTTVLTTESLQVQNFADYLSLNMINMQGLETLWLNNNSGNSEFDLAQNLLDIVVTGGDFYTDINYAAGVAGGAAQDQEILVDGADVHLDITGGVPNLWLQADGTPSVVDIESNATNVMVMGNSPSLELYLDDGDYVATFDSTGFAGNIEVYADIGNGSGTATVDTANGSDDLYLYGNYNSALEINTRNGNDYLKVANANSADVLLGFGDDEAWIGWGKYGEDQIGSGGVTVNGAKGEDEIHVNTSGDLVARTGDNSDELYLYNVGGDADVKTGWGFDTVTNVGGVQGFLTADLGLGDDTLNTYAREGASVIAASGNDNITITTGSGTTDNGDVTVKAGSGNNIMNVTINGLNNGSDYDDGTFFAGDDMDSLTFEGTGHLTATLRGGDDMVDVRGGVEQEMMLDLGFGNDTVDMGYQYLYASDTVTGDSGDDVIMAARLEYLNDQSNGGAFLNTTGVQTVETSKHWTGDYNGALNHANDSGVMTYNLKGNINGSTYMSDMIDDVQVNFWANGGSYYFEFDGAEDAGGTANLQFNLSASTTFYDFYISDVDILNVEGVDNDLSPSIPTLNLGSGASFIGDADLTTVNLSGSTHITMNGVSADNLAVIDGSGLSTNVYLDLNNVANAANAKDASIVITTGSGNDTVLRDDSSANYDITTGGGNDTVNGSGGNDNVKLGAGTDLVQFDNASDLDAFDTVNGGADTDTLQILSGGIVGDDNSFFLIKEVENWILSSSTDTLVMGNIAQTSGIQRISLGNGNDSLTLNPSYTSALEVTIGNGASNDTVDAGASAATLTVLAESNDLDGNDVITGGTGLLDELKITTVNGTATLNGMTAVEKVTVVPNYNGSLTINAVDSNVAAGATLTVTGSNNVPFSTTGALVFNGGTETDGKFVVTSGYGNDFITTGGGNDSISTGEGSDTVLSGDGNDTVNAGGGNDGVLGGLGDDSIDGGSGADQLFGDSSSADPVSGGNDTINAGSGNDTIFGGVGADVIDNGAGDLATDRLYYTGLLESFGSSVDQVSNFVGGVGGDIIDLTLMDGGDFAGTGDPFAGFQFLGNRDTFGQTQGVMTKDDGIIDVVFQMDDELLWVDLNDDATLNADDLQIHLIGVGLTGGLDAFNVALPA